MPGLFDACWQPAWGRHEDSLVDPGTLYQASDPAAVSSALVDLSALVGQPKQTHETERSGTLATVAGESSGIGFHDSHRVSHREGCRRGHDRWGGVAAGT